MKKVFLQDLTDFSVAALEKAGLTRENAQRVTDVLVTTDTFGVLSHGTKNLYQYILKMEAGGLDAKAEPSVVCEGPSFAMLNGNAAIGMLSARSAMELAIRKAKETGIAYVGVRNSCHFGAAGYYANLAAKEGLIGFSMSNGDPVMTAPNGKGVAIGNNPFSFAAPMRNGQTLFLDIALSSVAALKVIMAKEKGVKVPMDWLVDADGKPTDDPAGFPGAASLQPMAAHKGYGLAVMVEILASVMTGAGILSEITSWNLDMPSLNKVGHAFIAVDVSRMMPQDVFYDRLEQMVGELHRAPKAQNATRIFVPGEMEWEKRENALKSGTLAVTDVMAENYEKLAGKFGLTLNITEEA